MIEMLPMDDDESGAELRIINASFADPYLLILRDDSTVKIFRAIGNDEVEEIGDGGWTSTKWLSASLFKSSTLDETFAFLLTPEGGLHVGLHVYVNLGLPSNSTPRSLPCRTHRNRAMWLRA